MTDESEGKVKVVDRRLFTPEGELRDSRATEAPSASLSPPEPPPPPAQPTVASEPEAAPAQAPSGAGFLDLVDFLAQQAAALLSGQIPGRGRDPETARFFIDLLGVVQGKTAGQVSTEEASYVEDVLYQLRSLFVAATR